MKPIHFIRTKGFIILPIGLLLIATPQWFMAQLNAPVEPAGLAMIRLLGLLVVCMGYSFATASKHHPIRRSEALVNSICDATAVYFMLQATLTGVFNLLGYGLLTLYILSCMGFIYCVLNTGRN
jgi:hypothetical protein